MLNLHFYVLRDGEEWLHLRRLLNPLLLKDFNDSHKRAIEKACDRAVEKLVNNMAADTNEVQNLEKILYEWSIDGKSSLSLSWI